jgi:pimeloyl-ACP methyl ester carboxylesterase
MTERNNEQPTQPFTLRGISSFFVGGGNVSLDLAPTDNVALAMGSKPVPLEQSGDFETGQMYVQGFLGAPEAETTPLLMWHGGGMTGVTWETTPDGRPGWLELALCDRFDVYVSDAVERGRSSAPPQAITAMAPVFRTKALAWDVFRMGLEGGYVSTPQDRQPFPAQRFPMHAFDILAQQFVARWPELLPMVKTAYREYLAGFSASIIIAHSQAGGLAIETALAVPGRVRALILVEPSGAPDIKTIEATIDIPHLVIWGDYFTQSPRWRENRSVVEDYLNAVTVEGGQVDIIDLPARGIHGNSHCLMMDNNSAEIWAMVSEWIRALD